MNNKISAVLRELHPGGKVPVEVFLHNESVWLTQDKIAQLFGVQRPAITKHLRNIFETGELVENSVSSILEHTAADSELEEFSVIRNFRITGEIATARAESEFEKYRIVQDRLFESDFDREMKKLGDKSEAGER